MKIVRQGLERASRPTLRLLCASTSALAGCDLKHHGCILSDTCDLLSMTSRIGSEASVICVCVHACVRIRSMHEGFLPLGEEEYLAFSCLLSFCRRAKDEETIAKSLLTAAATSRTRYSA